VHTSAKARLTSVAIWIRIRIPAKFNHLFIGPLPTFPKNFMQIRLDVSAQSCQQTDKQRQLHILLGGGKSLVRFQYE